MAVVSAPAAADRARSAPAPGGSAPARKPPPPQLPAEESLPIPVAEAPPAEPAMAPRHAGQCDGRAATQCRLPRRSRIRHSAGRPSDCSVVRPCRAPTTDSADDGNAARSIFPADDASQRRPAPGPTPVVPYNPRPYRGRVVQLGAFPTPQAGRGQLAARHPPLSLSHHQAQDGEHGRRARDWRRPSDTNVPPAARHLFASPVGCHMPTARASGSFIAWWYTDGD